MQIYTIKTSRDEANEIVSGKRPFVFRSKAYPFKAGHYIQFQVVEKGARLRHPIEKYTYGITCVSDLPYGDDFCALGIARMP